MDAEPNMNNQNDQQETEVPLVPRNRPDVYTVSELLRSLMLWSRPMMDVLTWQLPIVTTSWLILGLGAIYFLTNYSLPSILGLVGLTLMGLVMLYAAIMRVEPYQELRRHPMLAEMRVPPEAVDLLAEMVTNWLNRWMATGQYMIFSSDYRPSVVVSITAFYLVLFCALFGTSKLLMIAYCFAFILPKLWLHWARDWGQLCQLPWQSLVKRQNAQQLPTVPEEEENVPEEEDGAENPQPEVNNI